MFRSPPQGTTLMTTAILEAGRLSLDAGGRAMRMVYAPGSHSPVGIEPEA